MADDIRITLLMEDSASEPRFAAEHGLSMWIEDAGKRILFDTGQSNKLIQNAGALNIHLADADAIVISHGHYDHTGGLPSVLEIAPTTPIYMHPAAVKHKFSRKPTGVNMIGMPDSVKKTLQGRTIIWTTAPARIFPRISVTGQVPRRNDYEDVGGAFFVDQDCRKPDTLPDDQTLFLESSRGLLIVFGCAHAGVVNIMNYISQLTGRDEVYAVIGGMHLLHANPSRIEKTIGALKKYRVQKIVPLHCTGPTAVKAMKDAFGDTCVSSGSGGQIRF